MGFQIQMGQVGRVGISNPNGPSAPSLLNNTRGLALKGQIVGVNGPLFPTLSVESLQYEPISVYDIRPKVLSFIIDIFSVEQRAKEDPTFQLSKKQKLAFDLFALFDVTSGSTSFARDVQVPPLTDNSTATNVSDLQTHPAKKHRLLMADHHQSYRVILNSGPLSSSFGIMFIRLV